MDLWKPDSYFADQDTHTIKQTKNSNIKLKYYHKDKVAVKCNMDFEHFPFDSHICKFLMKSLRGHWPGESVLGAEASHYPVIPGKLFHPRFHVLVDRFNQTSVCERNKSVQVLDSIL